MPKKSATATVAKVETLPVDGAPAIEQRHRVLAEAYLVHGNASQAAREAGFSPKAAHVTGCRILARPEVQAYITFRRIELQAEYGLERETVIREIKAIAHSDIEHYTYDDNGHVMLRPGAPRDAMRAVSKVKRTLRIVRNAKGKETERTVTNEIALWPKVEALRLESEILELTGKNAYPAAVRAAVGVAVQAGGGQQQQTRVTVQIAVVAE